MPSINAVYVDMSDSVQRSPLMQSIITVYVDTSDSVSIHSSVHVVH
jgi:hypothetical protein